MMASVTARRPVIGLTTSEIRLPDRAEQIPHADAGRRELVLGLTYMRALGAAGAAPVILAPLDPDAVPSMLTSVSGVCLPGGPDIDPVAYGADRDPDLGPTDRSLDVFELAVAREAERLGMPLLALCRGIQTLNVAHGGDLYQHLPSDPGGDVRHQRGTPADPGLEHDVTIDPDSLLGRVLGADRLVVNSFHHQAVRRLGERLRSVAWAPDGIVEGVEQPGADFRIGVQWHAEAMIERPEQAALFRAFVEAARRYEARTSATARAAEASQRT
jgi:putative glutamine amidotransferase